MGNWYPQILHRICENDFEGISDNKLTIITFNYDRSFDYFLYDSIRNNFSKPSEDDLKSKISAIPIIHIFGQLGYLPHQHIEESIDKPLALYETSRQGDARQVRLAASCIKLIHEVQGSPEIERAQKILNEADVIFFLGFAFHEDNMKLLFPDEAMLRENSQRYPNKQILSTRYRVMEAELSNIKRNFPKIDFALNNAYNVFDFLRNSNIFHYFSRCT